MTKLSPSILGCDYLTLGETIKELEAAGTDMLHLDVMDGIFVPNISFGLPVTESIKKHTSLPLDIHLMIDRPLRYVERFAKYADILGFHYEAGSDVAETLSAIKACGCKTCLTIKPCTPAEAVFPFLHDCDMVLVMSVEPGFGGQKFMTEALGKLSALRDEINRQGTKTLLETDGGVNNITGPECVKSGADVLVVGSYLFGTDDLKKTVSFFREL